MAITKEKILTSIVLIMLFIPISFEWYKFLVRTFCDAETTDRTQLIFKPLSNNTVEVSRYTGFPHQKFTIPSKILLGTKVYEVISIGDSAFAKSQACEIKIPQTVKSIGNATFYNCDFKRITISDGVTHLGDSAFCDCRYLRSVELPSKVKRIGAYSFSGCEKLTDIKIPDGVKSIGEYAFQDCIELKTIIIPSSVEIIGSNAFQGCHKLAVIIDNHKENVDIGNNIFYDCDSVRYMR